MAGLLDGFMQGFNFVDSIGRRNREEQRQREEDARRQQLIDSQLASADLSRRTGEFALKTSQQQAPIQLASAQQSLDRAREADAADRRYAAMSPLLLELQSGNLTDAQLLNRPEVRDALNQRYGTTLLREGVTDPNVARVGIDQAFDVDGGVHLKVTHYDRAGRPIRTGPITDDRSAAPDARVSKITRPMALGALAGTLGTKAPEFVAAAGSALRSDEERKAMVEFFRAQQTPAQSGGAPLPDGLRQPGLVQATIGAESSGKDNAKNPRSTATGPGQFLEKTWVGVMKRPEFAKDVAGKSPAEVLALRTNRPLAARAIDTYYAETIRPSLIAGGFAPTPANQYMAYIFGPEGFRRLMAAPRDEQAARAMGMDAAKANPELAAKTVGELIDFIGRRIHGKLRPPDAVEAWLGAPRAGVTDEQALREASMTALLGADAPAAPATSAPAPAAAPQVPTLLDAAAPGAQSSRVPQMSPEALAVLVANKQLTAEQAARLQRTGSPYKPDPVSFTDFGVDDSNRKIMVNNATGVPTLGGFSPQTVGKQTGFGVLGDLNVKQSDVADFFMPFASGDKPDQRKQSADTLAAQFAQALTTSQALLPTRNGKVAMPRAQLAVLAQAWARYGREGSLGPALLALRVRPEVLAKRFGSDPQDIQRGLVDTVAATAAAKQMSTSEPAVVLTAMQALDPEAAQAYLADLRAQ